MFIFRNGEVTDCIPSYESGLRTNVTFILPNETSLGIFKADGGWPELSTIRCMIERFSSGQDFVDVGANVGEWTLAFAAEPKVNHVYAFEPYLEVYKALTASIVINRFVGKVSAHQIALGDMFQVGERILHVPDPGGAGSTLLDVTTLPGWAVDHDTPRMVRCHTLDHHELENIGLIKLDVEGNELAVWRGMTETLANNDWPPVIFEAWSHPWFADRRELLREYVLSLGYSIDTSTFGDMWLATR